MKYCEVYICLISPKLEQCNVKPLRKIHVATWHENCSLLYSDSGFVLHGWNVKSDRLKKTEWINQKHLSKCTCYYSKAVAV